MEYAGVGMGVASQKKKKLEENFSQEFYFFFFFSLTHFFNSPIYLVLQPTNLASDGVITPEQFVAAGDMLVHQCPAWKW
jgi:hypothetical protein